MELGFVGIGRMGSPMVLRLLQAGHTVHVYDTLEQQVAIAAQRGAKPASSPKDVADKAEIVLASLPTPDIVRQAVIGPSGVARGSRARYVVDLSTTGPRTAAAIAAELAQGGLTLVDSPVSGGVAGAVKGTLAVMVSCPVAAFEAVRPVLEVFGTLFYVGAEPGQAQTLKLANNMLSAAALAASSEAMVMGVKAGIDPQVMVDVISASSGRNSAIQDKIPRAVLPRTFDFGFSNALSFKDVRLCVDEAEAMGIPMIIGAAVRQMLSMTAAVYGPDADCTEMVKLLETWSGVEVAARR